MTTIKKAIAIWHGGSPVRSGNVHSPDGRAIYSYGEIIGVGIELAPQGPSRAFDRASQTYFLIFDRTSKGEFVSQTTSRHTKLVVTYTMAMEVPMHLVHPRFESAYLQWKSDSFDARLARLRQIKGQGGWSGHDVIYWWMSFSTVYSEYSTDQEVVLRDYATGMRPGDITHTDPVFREMAADVEYLSTMEADR